MFSWLLKFSSTYETPVVLFEVVQFVLALEEDMVLLTTPTAEIYN